MRDFITLIGLLALGYLFLIGIGLLLSAPIWFQLSFCALSLIALVRFVVFVFKQWIEAL